MSRIRQVGQAPLGSAADAARHREALSLADLLAQLAAHRRLLAAIFFLAGAAAYGIALCLTPVFSARTTFLPPRQQTSLGALSATGALAGLAGRANLASPPEDKYAALLRSSTISDRIIDRFRLLEAYGERHREQARKLLRDKVRIEPGKKDGLLVVEVEDTDRDRAAAMANGYVDELRLLNDRLAVAQAQRRRELFEAQMLETREKLARAQQSLLASGFDDRVLNAAPRQAMHMYAMLHAQATAATVRLQVLREGLSENAPEVLRQAATLAQLRSELSRLESEADAGAASAYVDDYREFKYEQALLELYTRQFELARLDEGRRGMPIQVIDGATPAELKSRPRRGLIALTAALLALFASSAFILLRHHGRHARVAR